MTVDFPTKYPSNLTNTAWQASKKTTDKAGKTGLGPLLNAAQSAWNQIDFKLFDAKTAGAKTVDEAQENYTKARNAKRTVVKTALEAVVKAMKKAQAVSKTKLLSDKARTGAGKIAAGLDTLQGYLLNLTIDDLKREADRLAAEVSKDLALHDVTLRQRGGYLAEAQKAVKAENGTVTITGLDWDRTAGDPRRLLNQLMTVKAEQPDNSIWTNDMILKELSNDRRKAVLKAP